MKRRVGGIRHIRSDIFLQLLSLLTLSGLIVSVSEESEQTRGIVFVALVIDGNQLNIRVRTFYMRAKVNANLLTGIFHVVAVAVLPEYEHTL